MRQRIALWICPALKDELEALRSGNTKIVLENARLLDELAKPINVNPYTKSPPTNAFKVIADRFGMKVKAPPHSVDQ